MSDLPPALARLETLLTQAGGAFVPGQTLARAIGVPMLTLSSFVTELRRQRPSLVIEGRSGKGYRTVAPPASDRSGSSQQGAALQASAAATMLDLIGSRHAEIVRTIALESGETVENAVHRLLAYGIEVHRDLVLDGTNPLALVSP